MSTPVTRAPKRRIEKVRNRLNFTATNSHENRVIHTAEDSKTLVRMIVRLEVQKAITAVADMHLLFQLAPGGIFTITPTISQVLDVPASNMLLTEASFRANVVTAIGEAPIIVYTLDSKAMRKLKENDTIMLSTLCDVASAFGVVGHVTLFFKE